MCSFMLCVCVCVWGFVCAASGDCSLLFPAAVVGKAALLGQKGTSIFV